MCPELRAVFEGATLALAGAVAILVLVYILERRRGG